MKKSLQAVLRLLPIVTLTLFFSTNQVDAFDLPPGFENVQVIDDLADPDGFAFSPDGRMFISERVTGRLLVAHYNAGTDSWSVNAQPFYTFDIPKNANGEPEAHRSAGLRDIAFDPNFSQNGLLYAFYMKDDILHNRVVRLKASAANPDVADLTYGNGGEELLLELPFNDTISSGSHNGGAVEFGNDGKLYFTTGDGWEGTNPGDPVQSLQTFTGKVFRLNPDGSIPADNPFFNDTTGDYRAIYALGLRNPYSMSRHPDSGTLYINEARGARKDQIYIAEAEANYQHEGSGPGNDRDPWATAGDDGGELVTGGAWYPTTGGPFPTDYWGRYFVALWGSNAANVGQISTIASDQNTTVNAFETNVGLIGNNGLAIKPVITRIGPEGNLYYMLTTYTTANGAIHMIRYTDQETVATPQLAPGGGTYTDPVMVTMSTSTSGATIYFTTDNSDPTQQSTPYTGPILIEEDTVVKAKAYKNGLNPSSIASAIYIIGSPDNIPPVVDAGEDQSVTVGQVVTLDGSGSYDPDGDDDLLCCELWTQLSGPPVEIVDYTEEIAYFTPLAGGVYEFRLEMSDGYDTGSDTTLVTATPPQRVTNGVQVFYAFDEESGTVIHDTAENGPPLNLTISPGGNTTWLPGGGLAVQGNSLISGPDTKLHQACTASNALTLEAWVVPDNGNQDGPARILSFSADTLNRNFTLGQEGDEYDVRLRTTTTDNNGVPSLSTPAATVESELTHVVYTRDVDGATNIYVNGGLVATGSIGGNLSNWNADYDVLLANEATEDRPWLGEYHLVAIFCRTLAPFEVSQNYFAGANPLMLDEELFMPIIINQTGGQNWIEPVNHCVCGAAISSNGNCPPNDTF